ncbi:phosphatase [Thalassolituus sp. LLYu03]|uniref:phosphatase n=1 Tax=Thalassolituus sp. LLYu03 TaxID=3421656 RepID=UPI003D2D2BDE
MQDRPHRAHAQKIVQQFREEIGAELAASIGDYHLGSLAVLIESAINTSVMEASTATITEVETLLKRLRHTHGH